MAMALTMAVGVAVAVTVRITMTMAMAPVAMAMAAAVTVAMAMAMAMAMAAEREIRIGQSLTTAVRKPQNMQAHKRRSSSVCIVFACDKRCEQAQAEMREERLANWNDDKGIRNVGWRPKCSRSTLCYTSLVSETQSKTNERQLFLETCEHCRSRPSPSNDSNPKRVGRAGGNLKCST